MRCLLATWNEEGWVPHPPYFEQRVLAPQRPQAQAVGTAAMPLAATSPRQEASVQSSPLSKSLALAKRFSQHERDFLDFAKSSRNNRDEREISDTLAAIAERTYEYLD